MLSGHASSRLFLLITIGKYGKVTDQRQSRGYAGLMGGGSLRELSLGEPAYPPYGEKVSKDKSLEPWTPHGNQGIYLCYDGLGSLSNPHPDAYTGETGEAAIGRAGRSRHCSAREHGHGHGPGMCPDPAPDSVSHDVPALGRTPPARSLPARS